MSKRRKTKFIRAFITPPAAYPIRVTLDDVRKAFDPDALRRRCTMEPEEYWDEFGIENTYGVQQSPPDDFYVYQDRGAKILGIAHLDNVDETRRCDIVETAAGAVVFSPALDDRLGVYVICDLLPKLGVQCDVLLTTGEESGRSTAAYFYTEKQYNWMFQFDRGGTDVVSYQYETADLKDKVRQSGTYMGQGSFSDICFLDDLKVTGVNWGVGYQDYHGPRSHAFLEDMFRMVQSFMRFYDANVDEHMEYRELPRQQYASYGTSSATVWHKNDQGQWEWSKDDRFTFDPDEDEDETVYRSRSILDAPLPQNNVDEILAI